MPIRPGQLNVQTFVLEEKECEGRDCLRTFTPTFKLMRRCERCRKEKRPYKETDEPF